MQYMLGQIGSERAVLHGECRKWQMVALVVSRKLHTCMSSSNGKKEKVKLLLGKCYGECFSLSLSLSLCASGILLNTFCIPRPKSVNIPGM
jgi:hypothetical protein